MPGPHMWEEKSLDLSAPAFKARKVLPRSTRDAGHHPPAERPIQRPSKITKTTATSPFAGSTKSPLGSPIILTGDTALPPTPPPNLRDTHNQYNVPLAGPGHGLGVITSLASKGSGLSTPTNGRSPPTPDTTPPTARRRRPALPSPFSSSASRAESFQTAKEQWSSDDETSSMHSWRDGHHTSAHAFVEATRALRHGDRGLGFEFEQDDGDVTPTQDRTRRLQVPPIATKLNGQGRQIETNRISSLAALANRDVTTEPTVWDENLMRNVTLRRAKRPRSPPRQQQTAPNLDFIRIQQSPLLTPLLEDFDSRQKQLVRTPPMPVARPRAASGAANASTDSQSDLDGKRSSGMSSSSTIVEAVIRVSSTPSRAKTLKHVKKYTGLRNFSETSIDMSSTSLINQHKRDSTNSDDAPPRKLSHKRGSVGHHRDSFSSEADNAENASPRRPLKHHRDYSHLRSSAASSTATATPIESSPKKLRKISEISPKTSQLPGSTTPDTIAGAQRKDSAQQFSGVSRKGSDSAPKVSEPAPKASPKVLQKDKPPVIPVQMKLEKKLDLPKPKPEKLNLGPFPITPDPPSPVRARTSSKDATEPRTIAQPLAPLHSKSRPRSLQPRRPSDASNASDEARRVSFGGHPIPNEQSEHVAVKTMDSRPLAVHNVDEPRHFTSYTPGLYTPFTPLSMSSIRSEIPVVAEAKSVNIYPHNNESLLVIEHGGSPESSKPVTVIERTPPPVATDVQRAIDMAEPELELEPEPTGPPTPPPVPVATASQTEEILHLSPPGSAHTSIAQAPQLFVLPSTPPPQHNTFEVDSPLRNPRKPPQPPAVKLIPPTPFSEHNDPLDAAGAQRPPPQTPIRRSTLIQRARRYSDSFIQPLFSRTGSLKRTLSITQRSRPSTANNSRESRLHPLWRPRGFWDDFSDSESDDEFWGDGELMYGEDDGTTHRLPEGGDTSEVRSLEQGRRGRFTGRMNSLGKRAMDGFRGSGGFLIGNSLGLERAGTNRRRHHVQLHGRDIAPPPSHVRDTYDAAAARPATSDDRLLAARSMRAPLAHNATQPLSLRSLSIPRPPRSRSRSLSSFPSSYSSASGSARGARRWRRRVQARLPFRVEYVGLSGLAERVRERRAEKRRDEIRRSIGAPRAR